jgi:hypothetical protein
VSFFQPELDRLQSLRRIVLQLRGRHRAELHEGCQGFPWYGVGDVPTWMGLRRGLMLPALSKRVHWRWTSVLGRRSDCERQEMGTLRYGRCLRLSRLRYGDHRSNSWSTRNRRVRRDGGHE